ncbi:MAG: hypothetical protein U0821_06070 [Chloroflexota bacterium]
MADYYVSPTGDDSRDASGPAQAVRSLTRAMQIIAAAYVARGNVAVPETVHVGAGSYSRAGGEAFPITVLPLTTVEGAGRDSCVVEYSPPPDGDFPCGFSDTVLLVSGTVRRLSVASAFPPDVWYPLMDARLVDEQAVLEESSATGIVWVDAAARLTDVDFGSVYTQDGYERDGEIFPLIESCRGTDNSVSPTDGGEDAAFSIRGGRVERSTGPGFFVRSPGRTVIQNNVVPILKGFWVHRPILDAPPASDVLTPVIRNNTIQSADVLLDGYAPFSEICVFGESRWESNQLFAQRLVLGCTAVLSDNVVGARRVDFNTVGCFWDAIGPGDEIRVNCPVLTGNTFNQYPIGAMSGGEVDPDRDLGAFLTVTEQAAPVFSGNRVLLSDWGVPNVRTPVAVRTLQTLPHLWSSAEWIAERIDWASRVLTSLPEPDFGGGAGGSEGGNLFHAATPAVAHIKIQVGLGPYQLWARDNVWSSPPDVTILDGGTEVTCDVEGWSLE